MAILRRHRREWTYVPTELLGTVTCPTGDLLLMDFGLLELWSGDEAPVLEGGTRIVAESTAEIANQAVDLEIVGPDADAVAEQLDLVVVKGNYAFDVVDTDRFSERFKAVCESTGLQAAFHRIDRMPHRQRLLRLLDWSPEGVEVPFNGILGVAVRGVPRDRTLEVFGQRMDPDGLDAGKWHSVWVECDEREPVSSVEAGYVYVDEARLLFTDPTALSSWRHYDTIDGLADLVFHGRDARVVAEQMGARALEELGDAEQFGWVDRPVDEILELGEELETMQQDSSLRFAFDFRPHNDHYRLLSQAWMSPTGSGTIDVGGAQVTGFLTGGWGDGAFAVYRDVAADGTLCRVRVELGDPEIVARARALEERWFGEPSKLALISARVARDGRPVGRLQRGTPAHDDDSGWRVYSGDESQEYLDDPANAAVLPLRDLIEAEPTLEPLLRTLAPAAYERMVDGTYSAVPPQEEE